MTIYRKKSYPYPNKFNSLEDVEKWARAMYTASVEETTERVQDFDNLFLTATTVGTLSISTLLKPTSDNTVDLGAVGTTDYRFRHLYLSGNLSDETNALTVANAKSAYDHISADGTSHTYIDQDLQTTASPSFAGLAVSNASAGFFDIERTSSITNDTRAAPDIRHKTSANMADGFGVVMRFQIEDSAAVENKIADIGAKRSGADNTGTVFMRPVSGGSTQTGLLVDNNENMILATTSVQASMTKGFTMVKGTAPTGNQTNQFAMFADDIAAGNTAPHFRTENGTEIALDQSLKTTDDVTFNDITISTPSNIYALSHDSFADFVADEHVDWAIFNTNAFELDANDDMQPVTTDFHDPFFDMDDNGDIMPEDAIFQLDSNGDLMPT